MTEYLGLRLPLVAACCHVQPGHAIAALKALPPSGSPGASKFAAECRRCPCELHCLVVLCPVRCPCLADKRSPYGLHILALAAHPTCQARYTSTQARLRYPAALLEGSCHAVEKIGMHNIESTDLSSSRVWPMSTSFFKHSSAQPSRHSTLW